MGLKPVKDSKRKGIICLLTAGVLIAGFIIGMILFHNSGKTQQSHGYTMKEAYEIGLAEAKKWEADAGLHQIVSTDKEDAESSENGIDGKRNCWSISYGSPQRETILTMYIIDGEPVDVTEVLMGKYMEIDEEQLIDSAEAYKIAKSYDMTGGKDWAWGYHYILGYAYIDGKLDLCLSVRGIASSGNEMNIMLNPYDGSLMEITEKTGYDDNGRSIWSRVDEKGQMIEPDFEKTEDPDLFLTREEIMEKYDVFHIAAQYRMDPDELTDAIIDGIQNDYFSPFSNAKTYSQEEWERRMTEKYGDEWKNW